MRLEPYFDDGEVALYLGDCMEVMPQLGQFDLVFTSPPYNLGVTSGGGFADVRKYEGMKMGKWGGGDLAYGYGTHDDALDPAEYRVWQQAFLSAAWERLTPTGAIFYNHKPRVQDGVLWTPLVLNPGLPLRQIIVWARAGGLNFAPTHYVPTHEWIMVLAGPSFRLKSKEASGVGDVWRVPQEPSKHPAPFPLSLPARAIETVAPASVLDPYAGSGTTLVAAKAAGVRSVGIEIEERFCEMAVKRLAQGSLFGASA